MGEHAKKEASEKDKEQEQKKREAGEKDKAFANVSLTEQCFLLDNIKSLKENPPTTYESLSIIQGNPTEVFSRLAARTGMSGLIRSCTRQRFPPPTRGIGPSVTSL